MKSYRVGFQWHILADIFLYSYEAEKSPRARVAKFYGRLRLIRKDLRASNFPCLQFIEIVILWVYNKIPFGFTLFWHF